METRQNPSTEGPGDLDLGIKGQDPEDGVVAVSGLSWNATGSTVAVVYKYELHESWCSGHRTPINAWNLDRRDFDPGKPRHQVVTDSCQVGCGRNLTLTFQIEDTTTAQNVH